jgi:pilus assembly protein Flp/PilA
MRTLLKKFIRENNGATAIEYALLAALIFVVVIGGINALGGKTSGLYNNVSSNVSAVL